MSSEHLGDGAYVTKTEYGDYILTANHHDPNIATDVVCIEALAMDRLIKFVEFYKKKDKT